MLDQVLGLTTSCILILISCLHFYWAFGGKWAIEYTIPEKFKTHYFNEKYKTHIHIATIVVATGLLLFAAIITSNIYEIHEYLNSSLTSTLSQIIGAIFLMRAIGDFNICGLFKKSNESPFEKKDSQIYIPLCIFLGLSSIYLSL